ncbi:hypothetical protein NIES2135_17970 [Leptolyngbya boryana NIES-2135]|jgi:hypothetical protein|uniref:Lipoprotein n=1 Tax=Leptolyngbya boryana NIES-2135 TaxID=1973484 RepID=A0A1Z4JET0_LEPBY|nr:MULTISPECIES: hypothetical protein [Leptolyngbya]BAY54977.1 hypothetical protein NIES2135_17970 [Leptolyngbya boryana NIES-2135]MBD2365957.1 hypothetical protein [Leptolyngbya sp. FACHB-161]MBD2372137.1 hypothetical protein [Leptolyngbya sp. FACHB-238]MBD2396560.1 hypothetical protein [Leptolyngbya sp. FACHB-239]MBD2403083.1 hypothetical protein [Leptolyngbya sp. FACHB-402]
MNIKQSITLTIVGLGLLLGACSNSSNTATNPSASPATTTPTTTASPSTAATTAKTESGGKHGGKGGQTIETGVYHLEFIPQPEANGTHLDFYLQKGDNHEAVPNAKVTAQVQLPDGTQKALDMKYDPVDKHYAALLPGTAVGEYKVAILTDISGEKVNGRFSFKK